MRISVAAWLVAAGIILEGGGWDVDPNSRKCFAPATAEHYTHLASALACGNCTMKSVQRDDDSSGSSSSREQVQSTRRSNKTALAADPRGRDVTARRSAGAASAQAASARRLSALPTRRRGDNTSTTRPGPSRESSLSSRNSTTSRTSSRRRRELASTSRTPAKGTVTEQDIDDDDQSPMGSWTDAAGMGSSTPGEMTTTPTRTRTETRSTEPRGEARGGSMRTTGTAMANEAENYNLATRQDEQPEQDPTDRQPQYDEEGNEILDDWHEEEWSKEEWAVWMQSEHQPEEQAEEQEESEPQAVCVPFPQKKSPVPDPDPLEYFTHAGYEPNVSKTVGEDSYKSNPAETPQKEETDTSSPKAPRAEKTHSRSGRDDERKAKREAELLATVVGLLWFAPAASSRCWLQPRLT